MADTKISVKGSKSAAKGCAWILLLIIGVFSFLFYKKVEKYNNSPIRLNISDLRAIAKFYPYKDNYDIKRFLEEKTKVELTLKLEGDSIIFTRENSVIFTFAKGKKGCVIHLFKDETYNDLKEYIKNYTSKNENNFNLNDSTYLKFCDFDNRKNANKLEVLVIEKPKEQRAKDF